MSAPAHTSDNSTPKKSDQHPAFLFVDILPDTPSKSKRNRLAAAGESKIAAGGVIFTSICFFFFFDLQNLDIEKERRTEHIQPPDSEPDESRGVYYLLNIYCFHSHLV
jgi:hypothetical protein